LLTEKAYRAKCDQFLEPGEAYQFMWPPRGALWDSDSRHYDFPEDLDDEADGGPAVAIEDVDVVIESASWMWHLPVERVGDNTHEYEDPWLMGRAEVDPRTVECNAFGGDGARVRRSAAGGGRTSRPRWATNLISCGSCRSTRLSRRMVTSPCCGGSRTARGRERVSMTQDST
jgi:hypothetical protein